MHIQANATIQACIKSQHAYAWMKSGNFIADVNAPYITHTFETLTHTFETIILWITQ
jgi:hypothetical protein